MEKINNPSNISNQNQDIISDISDESLNKPFVWYLLRKSRNVTWDLVKKNFNKPWDWSQLSQNHNITWSIVKKTYKTWKWYYLSKNPNLICSDDEMVDLYIKFKSARRIQRAFREANTNPAYLLCKRRLLVEFNEMAQFTNNNLLINSYIYKLLF